MTYNQTLCDEKDSQLHFSEWKSLLFLSSIFLQLHRSLSPQRQQQTKLLRAQKRLG